MLVTKLNEKYFDNLLNDFFVKNDEVKALRTNITENKDSYTMELLVPGFTKEDINITLKDEYLTIEVNKKEEKEKEYLLKEINNYSYKRSYYVGKIEFKDIKAKLENGILTLEINKIKDKEIETRKIEIE